MQTVVAAIDSTSSPVTVTPLSCVGEFPRSKQDSGETARSTHGTGLGVSSQVTAPWATLYLETTRGAEEENF